MFPVSHLLGAPQNKQTRPLLYSLCLLGAPQNKQTRLFQARLGATTSLFSRPLPRPHPTHTVHAICKILKKDQVEKTSNPSTQTRTHNTNTHTHTHTTQTMDSQMPMETQQEESSQTPIVGDVPPFKPYDVEREMAEEHKLVLPADDAESDAETDVSDNESDVSEQEEENKDTKHTQTESQKKKAQQKRSHAETRKKLRDDRRAISEWAISYAIKNNQLHEQGGSEEYINVRTDGAYALKDKELEKTARLLAFAEGEHYCSIGDLFKTIAEHNPNTGMGIVRKLLTLNEKKAALVFIDHVISSENIDHPFDYLFEFKQAHKKRTRTNKVKGITTELARQAITKAETMREMAETFQQKITLTQINEHIANTLFSGRAVTLEQCQAVIKRAQKRKRRRDAASPTSDEGESKRQRL